MSDPRTSLLMSATAARASRSPSSDAPGAASARHRAGAVRAVAGTAWRAATRARAPARTLPCSRRPCRGRHTRSGRGACGHAPTAPTSRSRSARVRQVPPARRPGCARPGRTRARLRPCPPDPRLRPAGGHRPLRCPPRRCARRRSAARRPPGLSAATAIEPRPPGTGRGPARGRPRARVVRRRAGNRDALAGLPLGGRRRRRVLRTASELLGVVRRPRSTPPGPAPTVTPPVSPASTPTFTPSGPVVRSTPPVDSVGGRDRQGLRGGSSRDHGGRQEHGRDGRRRAEHRAAREVIVSR